MADSEETLSDILSDSDIFEEAECDSDLISADDEDSNPSLTSDTELLAESSMSEHETSIYMEETGGGSSRESMTDNETEDEFPSEDSSYPTHEFLGDPAYTRPLYEGAGVSFLESILAVLNEVSNCAVTLWLMYKIDRLVYNFELQSQAWLDFWKIFTQV